MRCNMSVAPIGPSPFEELRDSLQKANEHSEIVLKTVTAFSKAIQTGKDVDVTSFESFRTEEAIPFVEWARNNHPGVTPEDQKTYIESAKFMLQTLVKAANKQNQENISIIQKANEWIDENEREGEALLPKINSLITKEQSLFTIITTMRFLTRGDIPQTPTEKDISNLTELRRDQKKIAETALGLMTTLRQREGFEVPETVESDSDTSDSDISSFSGSPSISPAVSRSPSPEPEEMAPPPPPPPPTPKKAGGVVPPPPPPPPPTPKKAEGGAPPPPPPPPSPKTGVQGPAGSAIIAPQESTTIEEISVPQKRDIEKTRTDWLNALREATLEKMKETSIEEAPEMHMVRQLKDAALSHGWEFDLQGNSVRLTSPKPWMIPDATTRTSTFSKILDELGQLIHETVTVDPGNTEKLNLLYTLTQGLENGIYDLSPKFNLEEDIARIRQMTDSELENLCQLSTPSYTYQFEISDIPRFLTEKAQAPRYMIMEDIRQEIAQIISEKLWKNRTNPETAQFIESLKTCRKLSSNNKVNILLDKYITGLERDNLGELIYSFSGETVPIIPQDVSLQDLERALAENTVKIDPKTLFNDAVDQLLSRRPKEMAKEEKDTSDINYFFDGIQVTRNQIVSTITTSDEKWIAKLYTPISKPKPSAIRLKTAVPGGTGATKGKLLEDLKGRKGGVSKIEIENVTVAIKFPLLRSMSADQKSKTSSLREALKNPLAAPSKTTLAAFDTIVSSLGMSTFLILGQALASYVDAKDETKWKSIFSSIPLDKQMSFIILVRKNALKIPNNVPRQFLESAFIENLKKSFYEKPEQQPKVLGIVRHLSALPPEEQMLEDVYRELSTLAKEFTSREERKRTTTENLPSKAEIRAIQEEAPKPVSEAEEQPSGLAALLKKPKLKATKEASVVQEVKKDVVDFAAEAFDLIAKAAAQKSGSPAATATGPTAEGAKIEGSPSRKMVSLKFGFTTRGNKTAEIITAETNIRNRRDSFLSKPPADHIANAATSNNIIVNENKTDLTHSQNLLTKFYARDTFGTDKGNFFSMAETLLDLTKLEGRYFDAFFLSDLDPSLKLFVADTLLFSDKLQVERIRQGVDIKRLSPLLSKAIFSGPDTPEKILARSYVETHKNDAISGGFYKGIIASPLG
jgi:hypothetical protein